jgi:UDP-N-acetylmuramate--alanine ligase
VTANGSGAPVGDGFRLDRTHLIGVGGAGMSAIARLLLDRGLPVSGSDAKGSHVVTGLAARGVRTAVGHQAGNLDLLEGGPTAVVISTAIPPTNPELVAARERGIPVVRRALALAALMSGYRSVCVAGTHGKTSTTSMLTVALQHAGIDPSFAIGGELNESGTGAHLGSGDVFVAEADESDGSFLAYRPHGAIITNLEPDHLDHHGTAVAYAQVFADFVDRIQPAGFLVACADDPGVVELLAGMTGPGTPQILRYGHGAVDVRLDRVEVFGHGTRSAVALPDGTTRTLTLDIPGEHMALNATAALATGIALGVSADAMVAGLARYTGVRRRFEYKGRARGVAVYDDYAHHPTEVAAQLAAARQITGPGRLVVIFQPHLYSRTQTFATEFGTALGAADLVVQMDVYGAREKPQPGISGQLIVDAIPRGNTTVVYEPSVEATASTAAGLVRPGDLVITMGAGDVTMIGPELLRLLSAS